VAESRQFGSPKILQFGDKTAGDKPGNGADCARCEAMLADALDGALSPEDQHFFDLHMSNCGACAQSLADARRGAAFLEMLRHPAPEPPAQLVERILAQTSGARAGATGQPTVLPAQAGIAAYAAGPVAYPNVVPFPRRAVAAMRRNSFGHILLQPRLAMTAAMAFFSVALTMNITGFRPSALRASDLQPSSLKRDLSAANTRVAKYYEGLRVVYELESRVHDLQSASDDAGAGQAAPASDQPAAQPRLQNQPQTPATQPGSKQPDRGKPSGNAGTSHREDLKSQHLMLAALIQGETSDRSTTQACAGGTRA
jgi:hypothetical protein